MTPRKCRQKNPRDIKERRNAPHPSPRHDNRSKDVLGLHNDTLP
jgi:hypothetical protein